MFKAQKPTFLDEKTMFLAAAIFENNVLAAPKMK
jgi:hypothetical protein